MKPAAQKQYDSGYCYGLQVAKSSLDQARILFNTENPEQMTRSPKQSPFFCGLLDAICSEYPTFKSIRVFDSNGNRIRK